MPSDDVPGGPTDPDHTTIGRVAYEAWWGRDLIKAWGQLDKHEQERWIESGLAARALKSSVAA